MKKKSIIIALILLLSVGFAAVSTTLFINGNALFGTNNDEFDVIFTKAIVDGTNKSYDVISKDGKTITYETRELAIVGDESTLEFTVKNNSTQYDAEIEINCIGGNSLGTYYEITKSLPTEVGAQAKVEGNVVVTMIKSSVEELTEELTCTLNVTAVERNEEAELVPESETVITYSDEDSSGTRTIGDIVTISKEGESSESFYIISSDETNTTMMSMYNLYVGEEYANSTYTPYTNPTGVQDSTMIGYTTAGTPYRGVTTFSSDEQKGTNYSDYTGSIVEGYVNNYGDYLGKVLSVENSITLISKEELEAIIGSELSSGTNLISISAPAFLYSVSYWTSSAYDAEQVWRVATDGYFNYQGYNYRVAYGVRPVVTISSTLFETNEEENTCEATTTCNEAGDICWTDSDCSGTKNISDIVSLGTEENSIEQFYIISSDETNTEMMSMYNLYVGGDYSNATGSWVYTAFENPTGIQDSTMIGWNAADTSIKRGVTAFSSSSTDYSESIVEGYVNNYSTYLANTLKVENSATLISKEELETIVGSTLSVGSNLSALGVPSWLYSTSYWTRSAYDANIVWRVYSDGDFNHNSYTDTRYFGVRPVITISTNLI